MIKDLNSLQKFNYKLFGLVYKYINYIDNIIFPISILLVRAVLYLLAVGFTAFGSIPALYLLTLFMGTKFNLIEFLQILGVGIISIYVGRAIGKITKCGDNVERNLH